MKKSQNSLTYRKVNDMTKISKITHHLFLKGYMSF